MHQRDLGGLKAEVTFLDVIARDNGCIEHFFRALKEQLRGARHFSTIEELRQALLAFKDIDNRERLIAPLDELLAGASA